jgi:hypothetical protein
MVEILEGHSGAAVESPVEASANEGNQDFITVRRPGSGEILVVPTEAGQFLVLDFNPADARFALDGDDFVLTLEDGAQVVFQGLVPAAQGEDPPSVQIAGINIGAGLLIDQALALAGEDEPIETAAGEGEDIMGGGGSHYDDSFGDLIAGLIKQGTIGETDLGFGLTGSDGTEPLLDASLPQDGVVASYTLHVDDMTIIANEATGNLEIPDELILYLANASHGQGLSISGPSYDGVADNAYIWMAGGPALSSANPANTWASDGNGNVRFHIDGGNPFYEGSFTYEVTDGLGGSGLATIGVKNFATVKAGNYWTLDGTADGEVLLGLDGRNLIDGGGGDDIIHGGHDSSGDILIGGAGDDIIFGGSGKDDLQGGTGDDTFIMHAGFGRDDVDGGGGTDTITLDSVLTGADVASNAAISNWLTLNGGATFSDDDNGTITLSGAGPISGTLDLGGGNKITFQDIEQIVYTDVA